MEAGSMFGWEVPGADTDRYDKAGNLVRTPNNDARQR
jgi:hypothetical protein